ncbi:MULTISPECIES: CYTH domain-containing protein [unclassified Butyrivibrio]|jgi:CYTH domain-containing protein|uniref:CYTH domain-containing protein n=1 Tax=unclassified Butyrivibrio TaxID=2639466 RepID=UPI00041400B0|nr:MULTISPECIES: CYTH domain-containing protein [unclassified Butyrivibrio]
MGLEIERKFTVKELPENLEQYEVHVIEQGYLNVVPAIRVRRQDDEYYMTYKCHKDFAGAHFEGEDGDIGQIEYNMPLDKTAYEHLVEKADGNVIRKKRYIIPIENGLKIELDVFGAPYDGRILAEVEFPDEKAAADYKPADWFLEDVTGDVRYSNAHMSTEKL